MGFDAGDFALECFDPRLELVLRQGSKILFYQLAQRILRAAGKEVILVHVRNR